MPSPLILVAGATGLLGRALVAELARRGHRVRALSRRPVSIEGADETALGDLFDAPSLTAACQGVDAVVSAAGASLSMRPSWRSPTFEAVDRDGHLRLIAAAQSAQVRRFAYVSVHHAPSMLDLAYVRAHADVEAALERSGIDSVIVRPTGFFDALMPLLSMARWGVAPLIGDGHARSNPIAPEDLAAVVAEALEDGTPLTEAGGPDVLSRRAMQEAAFAAVSRTPRMLSVRPQLVLRNARLVQPIDARLADLLRFFVRVSTTDCVAPARGTRRLADFFVRQAA